MTNCSNKEKTKDKLIVQTNINTNCSSKDKTKYKPIVQTKKKQIVQTDINTNCSTLNREQKHIWISIHSFVPVDPHQKFKTLQSLQKRIPKEKEKNLKNY